MTQSMRLTYLIIFFLFLTAGADGEFLDYVSAEQAFMAVQMLAFELNNTSLQADLDAFAEALDNDERYRPSQFARLLRNL